MYISSPQYIHMCTRHGLFLDSFLATYLPQWANICFFKELFWKKKFRLLTENFVFQNHPNSINTDGPGSNNYFPASCGRFCAPGGPNGVKHRFSISNHLLG